MNILPIFTRDLGSVRHSDRLRKDRLVAGSVAGLIFVVLSAVDRYSDGVNVSRFLKTVPVAAIAPYFLLMIGLSLGTKLLSTERRDGTLPLLLLTHLSGFDVLFGKLLLALLVELNSFLAVVPAMVLPMLAAGFKWREISFLLLGCVNVVFFGLALGLFSAMFLDEERAVSWCLILVLPFFVLATPLVTLLPGGSFRECWIWLQPLNPGEALAHVQTMTGGFRPKAFWTPLLASHLFAWGLLGVGGLCLARVCRWREGRDAGTRPKRRWVFWIPRKRSISFRTHLLNHNPFLWLVSRNQRTTVKTWLYLVVTTLFWTWLGWLSLVLRGLNITIVLVIGLVASWMIQFLIMVPAEASRRLVEDRRSGALEMLLCTTLSVNQIIRGQWLALARRYLPPLIATMVLSLGLMVLGLVTDGFGGMLDRQDRAFWIFGWMAGISLLPLALTALCWVAMSRSLIARQVGDASAIAVLQVIGLPCLALPVTSLLLHSLFGWNPEWWWKGGLFVIGVALVQAAFAYWARAIFSRDLRRAAANRYFQPIPGAETGLNPKSWWRLIVFSRASPE